MWFLLKQKQTLTESAMIGEEYTKKTITNTSAKEPDLFIDLINFGLDAAALVSIYSKGYGV